VVHNRLDLADLPILEGATDYIYLEQLRADGWHVVTNIGRLTIQKGLVNLLHAAREVIKKQPKTIFLIVGSGEQYYELIELAAELGISKNVIFTGFLRGKAWRDSYAIGDLFIMPSVSEPFGLTVLEAIGYRTPTLISKQSGVGELIHHCLKADFWDIDSMANQIVAVIENAALGDSLRENAYRELERLSWDHAVTSLLKVYSRHLDQPTKLTEKARV
jgi:glycosyltransferase involved in cell wall biosynthesis